MNQKLQFIIEASADSAAWKFKYTDSTLRAGHWMELAEYAMNNGIELFGNEIEDCFDMAENMNFLKEGDEKKRLKQMKDFQAAQRQMKRALAALEQLPETILDEILFCGPVEKIIIEPKCRPHKRASVIVEDPGWRVIGEWDLNTGERIKSEDYLDIPPEELELDPEGLADYKPNRWPDEVVLPFPISKEFWRRHRGGMRGSDKQCDWAVDIRRKKAKMLAWHYVWMISQTDPEDSERLEFLKHAFGIVLDRLAAVSHAHWWIETEQREKSNSFIPYLDKAAETGNLHDADPWDYCYSEPDEFD